MDNRDNNLQDIAATQQQWIEEERLVRQNFGTPGSATLETIVQYSGMEFLQALLKGELHYPPITDTLNFSLMHVEPGLRFFKVLHYSRITTRSVRCTVAGFVHCLILHSAAPCNRNYNAASATPRLS